MSPPRSQNVLLQIASDGPSSHKEGNRVAVDRMESAGVRAVECYRQVRAKAERLCVEMDEVTPAHGIPLTDLPEEDSMVTSISSVIASHGKRG